MYDCKVKVTAFDYQRGSPAIAARYQLVNRLVPAWESQPQSGANWQRGQRGSPDREVEYQPVLGQ